MVYYDLSEVSKMSGLSIGYLRYLCWQRRLPHHKRIAGLSITDVQMKYVYEFADKYKDKKERGKAGRPVMKQVEKNGE